MTMPALVQKHRKQVVVAKLEKLSSTLMQAYRFAIAANDGLSPSKTFDITSNDPDNAYEALEKFYAPYLKGAELKKGIYGAYAFLTDGSAIYFKKPYSCGTEWSCVYLIVCLTHKACNEFPEPSGDFNSIINGKDTFLFYTSGIAPSAAYKVYGLGREELILKCKNKTSKEACTALIAGDGWKISDDYPIKF